MKSNGHILSDKIIKACDIRGIVPGDLDPRDAYFIGRSFGSYLLENNQSSCSVGRDGRLSSADFSDRLIDGLTESGIDVIDIGLVPVGTVYFSLSHLNLRAAVMVTASHNPADYNGFKFISGGMPFHGDQLHRLKQICREGVYAEGQGSLEKRDIRNAYLTYLHSFLKPSGNCSLKIIWDPGNGAVASVIREFTGGLAGTHILICDQVDGRFPHHHPDPSVEKNTEILKSEVLKHKADLGIAFDGDGDRMGVMDSDGHLYYGDQLLVLLALNILKDHPDSVIMSEVKASRFFSDEIRRMGGRPLLWKVGHTNQKEKMIELDIPLAGETSGHFYFRENGNFDDALFTAVKVLQQLCSHPDALIEMKKRSPVFHDSGELRISLNDNDPDQILNNVKRYLEGEEGEYSNVDGIRSETESGFWIIRKSNTEPHLTVRCEDSNREAYKQSLELIRKLLMESGLQISLD